jgi:hypothetical protein
MAVVDLLQRDGKLPIHTKTEHMEAIRGKQERVEKWLKYSADCGTLAP